MTRGARLPAARSLTPVGVVMWEFSAVEKWDGAPAPAPIGERLIEALFQPELPDRA